jgi:TorA maturation chaperone TorD
LPSLRLFESVFGTRFERQLSAVTNKLVVSEMKEGLKLINSFVTDFRDQPREEVLTRISIDRTRLLRGVNPQLSPPSPYESVYRDGRLWGKSTVEVSQICKKLGAKLPETWTEPPDYIGIEFDLMRLICLSESKAWQADDATKALEYLEEGGGFLRKHILQWVPSFCEKMYHRAELNFYKGTAWVTKGFIEYDSRLIEHQVDEVKKQLTEQS